MDYPTLCSVEGGHLNHVYVSFNPRRISPLSSFLIYFFPLFLDMGLGLKSMRTPDNDG